MTPTGRGLAAWFGYLAFLVLVDGMAGASAALVVGVVVLAGLPRRAIGITGVVLLAAVPVAVVAGGVPSEAAVSPAFPSRSLWPHHLTIVGLALVSAAAVLDLVALGRSGRSGRA